MPGLEIVRADGGHDVIEATGYVVDDDGALLLRLDELTLRRYAPGTWIEVRALGVPLADHWPPDDLDVLLERLHVDLCVGLGDCAPWTPPTTRSGAWSTPRERCEVRR
jgi:hypothetical protein